MNHLIDLHRHLEGSIRLQTILELGQQHNIRIPAATPEQLHAQLLVIDRPVSWMTHVDWGVEVLADLAACRRVAREAVEDAHAEGLEYLELRFSPYYMARPHRLPLTGVLQAVVDGVRVGSAVTGLHVGLIGILSRTYGLRACSEELATILQHKGDLVAVDLAGDECRWPAEMFTNQFKLVRDAGLGITIHAGERDGAQSVWHAIEDLHATRIGHGLRATDDPRLLDHLAARGIGLEVCLTSNVQAKLVDGYASHPLKMFLEHGILATLNTDNQIGRAHV